MKNRRLIGAAGFRPSGSPSYLRRVIILPLDHGAGAPLEGRGRTVDDGEAIATTDAEVAVPRPAEPVSDGDEGQDVAEQPARRRRVQGGRRHKHSVRFTADENALVQAAADAAGLTVPHLIAETVLASLTGRGTRQMPVADRRALAHELAAVRSFLAAIGGNVNQLAAAANSGNIPATGAVEATMNTVARAVARLDTAIAPLDPRTDRHTARRDEPRDGEPRRDERRAAG